MKKIKGKCPHCDASGLAGSPCQDSFCQRKGYHIIPLENYENLADMPVGERDHSIGFVIQDYLVVDKIGEGGFGKLYLTLQLPLFMKTALKLMSAAGSAEPATLVSMMKKFETEAMNLASLHHPNIVRILKYGTFIGLPFIVMEYVDDAHTFKEEIRQRHRDKRPFDSKTLRHILEDILNALECAHQQQIIHMDIKPTNIMLQKVTGDPYHVRVLDFGLSRLLETNDESGVISGTPAYMAPEQVLNDTLGPWTDLYALAILMFQLVLGKRPYPGQTAQEILNQKLRLDYNPLSTVPESVPFYVKSFFRKALARDADLRYRSVPEFREALQWVFDNLEQDSGQKLAVPELSEGGEQSTRSSRSISPHVSAFDSEVSDEIWRTPSLSIRLSTRAMAWAGGFLVLLALVLFMVPWSADRALQLPPALTPETVVARQKPPTNVVPAPKKAPLLAKRPPKPATKKSAIQPRPAPQRPAGKLPSTDHRPVPVKVTPLPVKQVVKKQSVSITIQTKPKGALLYLDGKLWGVSPKTWATLPSDKMVRLKIKRSGYQKQQVMIPRDRDRIVSFTLKKSRKKGKSFIRKIWK